MTVNGVSFVQVQPAFLYESRMVPGAAPGTSGAAKRRRSFRGRFFCGYLTCYGLGQISVCEWLRTDKLCDSRNIGIAVSTGDLREYCLYYVRIMGMVRRTMAKKRAKVKKRRREEDYEAEEKAAREAEGHDSLEADDLII